MKFQAQEAQEHQQDDKLKLDEILAMCAEYEEQIAKEIEDNKNHHGGPGRPKLPLTSSLMSLTRPSPSNANGANSVSNGEKSPSSPPGSANSTTNGSFTYSR